MSITAGSGVEVVAIDTPALGDRSYLAHDGSVALVVDPQRDIDRVLALAAARRGTGSGARSSTRSMSRCGSTTTATCPSCAR